MRSPKSRRLVVQDEDPPMTPNQIAVIDKVAAFSDADLRRELSHRNFSCGPIVGTTRSVYRKKLVALILADDEPREGRHSNPMVLNAAVVQRDDHAADGDFEEPESASQDDQSEDDSSQEIESATQSESTEENSDVESQPLQTVTVPESAVRQRVPHFDTTESSQTTVSYVSEDGRTVKRTTTTTRVIKKVEKAQADEAVAPRVASQMNSRSIASSDAIASQSPTKEKTQGMSCWSILLQLLVIAVISAFVYFILTDRSPLALVGQDQQQQQQQQQHDVENPPFKDGNA